MSDGLIYGVGNNDADYKVQPTVNGKQITCIYYSKWFSMFVRCYSKNSLSAHPTYEGCSVCEEWHSFSNFKAWRECQDFEGKVLDKDIISVGNKVYSPNTCTFVPEIVNAFITDSHNVRGKYMVGVHKQKKMNKFIARCGNPFTGGREYLGCHFTELEAHEAWRVAKLNFCEELIEKYKLTGKVASGLLDRYKSLNKSCVL